MKNILRILIFALASLAGKGFAQGPFNIGTLPPGDSVVIYYDVAINNPLVPPNAPSISNQGTVSGSNFASALTDDPASPTAGDATVTLLNSALPVVLREFRAYRKEQSVVLAWRIDLEENTLKYEIEKSPNGRAFNKIGEVMATGGKGVINYKFTDKNPSSGFNYYRLKILDFDATYVFTGIEKVTIGETGSSGNLYPNPVSGNQVNLELVNLAKGKYYVTLTNASGQVAYTNVIEHGGGSCAHVMAIPVTMRPGIYIAEIKGGNMKVYKKLVVN
ncbi:hypothetical protein GCM10023091_29410 [Ravibacter arvi]|uniref:Secretion system C-terminal sorting domain-containing protein n=1 Tax=Ravibacter arvi TaxID=2051041 RepID=A0ABP8M1C3_9BACT